MNETHKTLLLNTHLNWLIEANKDTSEKEMPLLIVYASEILRLREALTIAKSVMEGRCWVDNPNGADFCIECGNSPRDGHKGTCDWNKINFTEVGGEE